MDTHGGVLDDLERALAVASSERDEYFFDHRRRYAHDLQLIARLHRGGEILEVGSFPCHLTYCLQRLGYPTVGVDLNPERVAAFIAAHGLNVVPCDVESGRLPFADGRFALVVFNEVFEHLRIDPIGALRDIHRVLAPGGALLLTTPNLYSLRNVISFCRGRGMMGGACQEFEKLRTVGHMGHVREYAAREVEEFLDRTGFEGVERRTVAYDRSRSGRLVDVCYRLVPPWRPYQVFISRKIAQI